MEAAELLRMVEALDAPAVVRPVVPEDTPAVPATRRAAVPEVLAALLIVPAEEVRATDATRLGDTPERLPDGDAVLTRATVDPARDTLPATVLDADPEPGKTLEPPIVLG